MKGQLIFDEFMNITEEKPPEHKQERVPMVDPCYYCLCRSCINNAESRTITPDELPYDWQPCFFVIYAGILMEKARRIWKGQNARSMQ